MTTITGIDEIREHRETIARINKALDILQKNPQCVFDVDRHWNPELTAAGMSPPDDELEWLCDDSSWIVWAVVEPDYKLRQSCGEHNTFQRHWFTEELKMLQRYGPPQWRI